jgi:hypothetical protein
MFLEPDPRVTDNRCPQPREQVPGGELARELAVRVRAGLCWPAGQPGLEVQQLLAGGGQGAAGHEVVAQVRDSPPVRQLGKSGSPCLIDVDAATGEGTVLTPILPLTVTAGEPAPAGSPRCLMAYG